MTDRPGRFAAEPPFAVAARARALVRRMRSRLYHEPSVRQRAALRRAELVTIDVFDTAVLRSVSRPDDVFALAAWRFGHRLAKNVDIRRVRRARIRAEAESRRRASARGEAEITLADIYELLDDVDPADRDRLMAEELATERDVCVGNPDLLRLCAQVQSAGTPVAFVSDTYFSTAFVEDVLRTAGYRSPYRVFTSSQWGQTKAGGGLFGVVARETGAATASIVHVGDNARSDVENGFRAGVRPLWYVGAPRPAATPSVTDPEAALASSLLNGIAALRQRNAAAAREGPWARIGVLVAAPVYLGFVQWLRAQLHEMQPDRVLFCARDGLIVKNVYDRLERAGTLGFKTDYFTVSRRVLVFPSFERLGAFELDFLCSSPVAIAVRDYLQRIGLDAEHVADVLAANGLSADQRVACGADRMRLRAVMTQLSARILSACAAERRVLLSYLDELECRSWRRIAICDVGWHGTLQHALTGVMHAVNDNVVYRGFYLGTSARAADLETDASTTCGWIWNRGEPRSRMEVQENGREVIELLFTARHGSIVGRHAGTPTKPVFDEIGTLDVANRIAADSIQTAALAAIEHYITAFGGTPPATVSSEAAFTSLVRLIERPTIEEVGGLGKLVHVAGFGSTQTGQPLAVPPSLWAALRRPRAFLEGYRTCRWPTGFLTAFFGHWRIAYVLRSVRRRLERSRGA